MATIKPTDFSVFTDTSDLSSATFGFSPEVKFDTAYKASQFNSLLTSDLTPGSFTVGSTTLPADTFKLSNPDLSTPTFDTGSFTTANLTTPNLTTPDLKTPTFETLPTFDTSVFTNPNADLSNATYSFDNSVSLPTNGFDAGKATTALDLQTALDSGEATFGTVSVAADLFKPSDFSTAALNVTPDLSKGQIIQNAIANNNATGNLVLSDQVPLPGETVGKATNGTGTVTQDGTNVAASWDGQETVQIPSGTVLYQKDGITVFRNADGEIETYALRTLPDGTKQISQAVYEGKDPPAPEKAWADAAADVQSGGAVWINIGAKETRSGNPSGDTGGGYTDENGVIHLTVIGKPDNTTVRTQRGETTNTNGTVTQDTKNWADSTLQTLGVPIDKPGTVSYTPKDTIMRN